MNFLLIVGNVIVLQLSSDSVDSYENLTRADGLCCVDPPGINDNNFKFKLTV